MFELCRRLLWNSSNLLLPHGLKEQRNNLQVSDLAFFGEVFALLTLKGVAPATGTKVSDAKGAAVK